MRPYGHVVLVEDVINAVSRIIYWAAWVVDGTRTINEVKPWHNRSTGDVWLAAELKSRAARSMRTSIVRAVGLRWDGKMSRVKQRKKSNHIGCHARIQVYTN